jgi:hypothetical protein
MNLEDGRGNTKASAFRVRKDLHVKGTQECTGPQKKDTVKLYWLDAHSIVRICVREYPSTHSHLRYEATCFIEMIKHPTFQHKLPTKGYR